VKSILKSLWFGLVVSFALSATVTLVICIWEWIENPGGIFHDANGTNWQFIVETGMSWFIPTFLNSLMLTSILHFVFNLASRKRDDSADGSDA